MFKYIIHLNGLHESSIAKQAFLISKNLHLDGKASFYSNVTEIIMKLYVHSDHIPELESISNRFILQLSGEIRSKYITFWTHKLRNSAKLSFYSKFKNEYEMEEFLSIVKKSNTEEKQNFAYAIINYL